MVPCEISVPNFSCPDFSAYILLISEGLAIGPVSPTFFAIEKSLQLFEASQNSQQSNFRLLRILGGFQKWQTFFQSQKKKWGKLVRLPNPLRGAICMY